jgi:hypothetical protein
MAALTVIQHEIDALVDEVPQYIPVFVTVPEFFL